VSLRKRLTLTTIALALTLTVSACKSAEERAEDHYQTALSLIAEGDIDRAVVELRNVFQLDGSHREARRTLAHVTLTQRGNRQEAYSQYLRLAEQYPDDLDARLKLSEIAFTAGNWDELERHGAKAEELAPNDSRVIPLTTARKYRSAVQADDASARREVARTAAVMLVDQDNNIVLRSIVIDNMLREGDFRNALAQIDRMLEQEPENLLYNQQRLNVLVQLGDMTAVETHLKKMIERFPNETAHKAMLLRFYMSEKNLEQAESFLRELAEAAPADDPGPAVDLIRFLAEFRSIAAAKAEIASAIPKAADPLPFKVLDAGLDFAAGSQETAVTTLEAALKESPESEHVLNVKVTLARMLLTMGNDVGARARVEEVLAEDATQPEALKMKAGWLTKADQTDAAIAALRSALDRAPNDAQAMTLMAEAYSRSGRPELAREFLALAVDASGNAPENSIRYAQVLMAEKSFLPAEDILISSLRLSNDNPDLLLTLGQLYLQMEDFGRAQQVANTLRRLNTPETKTAADGLDAERINLQSGRDEAMAYLEQIANTTDATLAARIALVRARMGTGDIAGALELAKELSAENKDNDAVSYVLATTEAVNGNLDEAETTYRTLVNAGATRTPIWLELSRIKQRKGDSDGARAVIKEALVKNAGDPNLLWATASFLEQDGDIDGAIAIYEQLYEDNSDSPVIANNLASLLASYREDPESLDRAWIVARRFRDTSVPAVQDTYGWLLQRRGESAEALPYLEAAAEGLPTDPLVQYHLAQTYLALERPEDALDRFQRTVDIAGPGDSRPQINTAREMIRTLIDTSKPASAEN